MRAALVPASICSRNCGDPARMSIGSLSCSYWYGGWRQSGCEGVSRWNIAMSAAPVSTGLNARRSVTCTWQPPQACFACFWNVGSNMAGRKKAPGQPQRVHLAGEALGLDARRAHELERPRGAASF